MRCKSHSHLFSRLPQSVSSRCIRFMVLKTKTLIRSVIEKMLVTKSQKQGPVQQVTDPFKMRYAAGPGGDEPGLYQKG
jgi:hypothetical protein